MEKTGQYYRLLERKFDKMEELSEEELAELISFHEMLASYYHGTNSIHSSYHNHEQERYEKVLFYRQNFD